MKRTWLLILLLLISTTTFAQKRQSVGLVLSGGGARGLAHVGVLKALEEENIPIDYIAGTSIGAIIGGLYASGYSPSEIEEIFLSSEFQSWLEGHGNSKQSFYFKDKHIDPSFFSFNFDARDKLRFQIPSSIRSLDQLDFIFMQLFANANLRSNNNFDSLFIPFLCIATDIESNTAKTLRTGDLAKAVRASMTFPFYFSPITIDGRIMFDGGMYNNFPSDEVEKYFNPDIIIGVKLAANYLPPKEGDIISYLQNILTGETDYSISNGVMIEPNLQEIGVLDFSKMKKSLSIGYWTAKEAMEEIKERIEIRQDQKELRRKRQEFRHGTKDSVISKINIKGVSNKQAIYIEKTLLYYLYKQPLTLSAIKENYLGLEMDNNISSVQSKLFRNPETKELELDVDIRTKEYLSAKTGGILSTDPISHLFLGLDYNFLRNHSYLLQSNIYAGRYYTSYSLRVRIDYATKLPLFSELELNDNKWSYYRLKTNFFDYSPLNYMVQEEQNVQFDLGTAFSRREEVRFNIGYGVTDDEYFNINHASIYDTTDRTTFKHLATGLTRTYSTLDSPTNPLDGIYSRFQMQYVFGVENFEPGNTSSLSNNYRQQHSWLQFLFKHRQYHSTGKYLSLGVNLDIFYSLQNLFSNYNSSLLNAGIYSPTMETITQFLPEYRANQFIGIGGEAILKKNILRTNSTIHFSGYLFSPMQRIITLSNNLPAYSGSFFSKQYLIFSTSISFHTIAGPLSIIASYHQRDNKEDNPFTISVNFGNLLFNNRNIKR